MDIKIGSIYRHFKGKSYKVIDVAKDCKTMEDVVIYEPQYQSLSRLWTRPVAEWNDEVDVDGQKVPRFQLVE